MGLESPLVLLLILQVLASASERSKNFTIVLNKPIYTSIQRKSFSISPPPPLPTSPYGNTGILETSTLKTRLDSNGSVPDEDFLGFPSASNRKSYVKEVPFEAGSNREAEQRLRTVIMNRTLSKDGDDEDEFDRILFSTIPNGSKLILKTVKLVKADRDGNIEEEEDDDGGEEGEDYSDEFEDTKGTNWNMVVHKNGTPEDPYEGMGLGIEGSAPRSSYKKGEYEGQRSGQVPSPITTRGSQWSDRDKVLPSESKSDGAIHLIPGRDLDGAAGSHHSGHYGKHGGNKKGGKHHDAYYHKGHHGHQDKKGHKETHGVHGKAVKGGDHAKKHHYDTHGHKVKLEGGRHKESHKKNKGRRVTGFKRVYHKEEYQKTEHFYDDEHANKVSEHFGLKDQKEKSQHGKKEEGKKYSGNVLETHKDKKGTNKYLTHGEGHKGGEGGHKSHGAHNQGKHHGEKGGYHGGGSYGGHGGGGGGAYGSHSSPNQATIDPNDPLSAPPTLLIAKPTSGSNSYGPPLGSNTHLQLPMTYIALSSIHNSIKEEVPPGKSQGRPVEVTPRSNTLSTVTPTRLTPTNSKDGEMRVFYSPRERFIPSIPPSPGISYVPHITSNSGTPGGTHPKRPLNIQSIKSEQDKGKLQNHRAPNGGGSIPVSLHPPRQIILTLPTPGSPHHGPNKPNLTLDWRKPPHDPNDNADEYLRQFGILPKGNSKLKLTGNWGRSAQGGSEGLPPLGNDSSLEWVRMSNEEGESEGSSSSEEVKNSRKTSKKGGYGSNPLLNPKMMGGGSHQAIIKVHPMQFFNISKVREPPRGQGHRRKGPSPPLDGFKRGSPSPDTNIMKWTNSVPISNHEQGVPFDLGVVEGLLKESATNNLPKRGPVQPPSSPLVPPPPPPSHVPPRRELPPPLPPRRHQGYSEARGRRPPNNLKERFGGDGLEVASSNRYPQYSQPRRNHQNSNRRVYNNYPPPIPPTNPPLFNGVMNFLRRFSPMTSYY